MISRRNFIQITLASTGGLCLGVTTSGCGGQQWPKQGQDASLRPNMYIALQPDGGVVLTLNKSEMGQGVMTSHAMLVAEELEVPVDAVEVRFADGAKQYRTSFGMQQTGGSTSTAEHYVPLRQAAAAAREMLVAAAAQSWGVAVTTCVAQDGAVIHKGSDRRMAYAELLEPAAKQPIPENPRIKERSEFKIIGKPMVRNDALMKSNGSARFGIDTAIPGMVKAAIIHPPVLGSRATAVKADAARAVPGVIDVLTLEHGVAVVADKYWQAKRAAAMVEITWSRGVMDNLNTDDIRTSIRAYDKDGTVARSEGNANDAFASDAATTTLEAFYEVPFLAHAPMAPQNAIAHVRDGEVEIWAPTQGPTVVQELVGRALGISRSDVIVHTTLIGGGFGRRVVPDGILEAVQISQKLGRPVQIIWSRESDTRQGYYRPLSACKLRGAIDAQGTPIAWSCHLFTQSLLGAQSDFLATVMPDWSSKMARQVLSRSASALASTGSVPDPIALEGAATIPYDIENLKVSLTPLHTRVPIAFWRSVGHSHNAFFVESFIDELAYAADTDPLQFRRGLLAKHPRWLAVLEAAAKFAGWGQPLPRGMGRGIAVHESFGSMCAEVVEAGIFDGEIKVARVVAAMDCGVVINPDIVKSQVESAIIYGLSAAIHQKLDIVDGQVVQGNFDDYPALRMHECPEIDVHIMISKNDPSGVGEPGLPPIAPALANALYAANRVRLRRLPLMAALADANQ